MYVLSKGRRKDSDNRFLQPRTLGISKVWDHFQKQQILSCILTFSQFISFKIGAVPNGHVPTSIIWSSLIQPGFHFPNRIQISTAPKSRFETSIKLTIITLLIVLISTELPSVINNVADKTSLPLITNSLPGMSINNCGKKMQVAWCAVLSHRYFI